MFSFPVAAAAAVTTKVENDETSLSHKNQRVDGVTEPETDVNAVHVYPLVTRHSVPCASTLPPPPLSSSLSLSILLPSPPFAEMRLSNLLVRKTKQGEEEGEEEEEEETSCVGGEASTESSLTLEEDEEECDPVSLDSMTQVGVAVPSQVTANETAEIKMTRSDRRSGRNGPKKDDAVGGGANLDASDANRQSRSWRNRGGGAGEFREMLNRSSALEEVYRPTTTTTTTTTVASAESGALNPRLVSCTEETQSFHFPLAGEEKEKVDDDDKDERMVLSLPLPTPPPPPSLLGSRLDFPFGTDCHDPDVDTVDTTPPSSSSSSLATATNAELLPRAVAEDGCCAGAKEEQEQHQKQPQHWNREDDERTYCSQHQDGGGFGRRGLQADMGDVDDVDDDGSSHADDDDDDDDYKDHDDDHDGLPRERFQCRERCDAKPRRPRPSRRWTRSSDAVDDNGDDDDDDDGGGCRGGAERAYGRARRRASPPPSIAVAGDATANSMSLSSSSPPSSFSSLAKPDDTLILFGVDISTLPPSVQFAVCAAGVFGFTIVYGYLQELLSVTIAGRRYALFLASAQFAGYAVGAIALWALGGNDGGKTGGGQRRQRCSLEWRRPQQQQQQRRRRWSLRGSDDSVRCCRGMRCGSLSLLTLGSAPRRCCRILSSSSTSVPVGVGDAVPLEVGRVGGSCGGGEPGHVSLGLYVLLSLIRSVDLGMTNGAMQYLNYPAKTLIKSSRVAFTMLLGLVIGRKRYRTRDYALVAMLVIGLGVFLHADATSDAVFHPIGVAMLVVSLTCDGVVANWSEVIMRKHAVSHDEFQAYLYSIAFFATTLAAHLNGELLPGMRDFFLRSGTVEELLHKPEEDVAASSWNPARKAVVLLLFSGTGLLGSSCAGAITKRFGALSMSVTSTARKAGTLFLSFIAFQNRCTPEHVAGMAVFLTALFGKAVFASRRAAEEQRQEAARANSEGTELGGDAVVVVACSASALHDVAECGQGASTLNRASCGELEDGLSSRVDVSCVICVDDEADPLMGGKRPEQGHFSLFEAAKSSRRLDSLLQYMRGTRSQQRKWSSLNSNDTHAS